MAGCAAQAATAVLRRVRMEMRPVGGSSTEAPDGGVGARGGNSGGVTPEDTASTGVKVASAAGQNGARLRRSSSIPTKEETRATNLPVGAERSSFLIRGPCARESLKSVEVRGSPPKTALSGRGTNPPKPMPGTDVEGVSRPQALTRRMTSLSTGVRRLEPLRSCSVAGCGNRERNSALPFALPLCSQTR